MTKISEPVRVAKVSRRPDWLIPVGLVLLSLVPVLAGAARLNSLVVGEPITSENARFFGMPIPVVVHIISATIYCLVGAFQFHPGLRRRRPRWHRMAGRVLAPLGIAAALSGLWMTAFYALPAHDYGALPAARWVFGLGMAVSIVLGFLAVRRRDFTTHRAWMIRAYAIAIGAGTQVLTTLLWFLIVGADDSSKPIPMIAGWVINLVIAEWVIRRRPTS